MIDALRNTYGIQKKLTASDSDMDGYLIALEVDGMSRRLDARNSPDHVQLAKKRWVKTRSWYLEQRRHRVDICPTQLLMAILGHHLSTWTHSSRPRRSERHPPCFPSMMADYRNFSRVNPSKGAADNIIPVVMRLPSCAFCSIDLLPFISFVALNDCCIVYG